MSAFLAPIHYNMYEKIMKQNSINNDLIRDFGNDELNSKIISEIGKLPEGNLEDIIDHGNIHGWLQGQIEVVESSFSLIVESLLENGLSLETLTKWFEDRGKSLPKVNTGEEVYRGFVNSFLDGMPCDRAIQPLEFTEDSARWIQNVDVHGKYWSDGGTTYNTLRAAWIKGLANSNDFVFNFSDGTYEVKR